VNEEFYIGYEPEMPSGLAPRIRATAVALVTSAMVLAGVLVTAQHRFADGLFAYGHEQWFEGRIVERPYPALDVSADERDVRWFWLVGPGKHGAADFVKGLDGRRVRLAGSLIEREGERMIEVVPATLTTTSSEPSAVAPLNTIGPARLDGEIVDSKCHLGVMKPGEGPTHRDCAVRCLLGSIPPMLVIRDGGHTRRVPLVVTDGPDFSEALPALAGGPVRVHGMWLERGGRRFLATSVPGIEFLGAPTRIPQH
jgi:hypothetical protein